MKTALFFALLGLTLSQQSFAETTYNCTSLDGAAPDDWNRGFKNGGESSALWPSTSVVPHNPIIVFDDHGEATFTKEQDPALFRGVLHVPAEKRDLMRDACVSTGDLYIDYPTKSPFTPPTDFNGWQYSLPLNLKVGVDHFYLVLGLEGGDCERVDYVCKKQ